MKGFTGLLPAQSKRPIAAFFGPAGGWNIVRDQLTISTWLSLGAIAQGLLFLVAGRPALIPALGLLLYRGVDTYAMSVGWKRNRYMDDVITKKFTAQFPNDLGDYGTKPADKDVVVFLIGTRCNHPLGLLAPGFKEFGSYFPQMARKLEEHAEEFGYLGMTSWLNASERTAGSEIMSVAYFRTVDGLHRFAHSEHHREGWEWYSRHAKQYPHFSIFHETYHVPSGHYESIYANSHTGGITSTTVRYTDSTTGGDMWASPVVDASKGVMKTSAGRMARSDGLEHEKYEESAF